ncbi:hypothetical protein SAMN04489860_1033 [Paraoerskovia marina]|uniref:Polyketide cyclase / dehydrase and lipid transport n=1 Tax=Paraoerskovia marina TaxID=545619 RepID=A0A1H1QAL3_9CELL|nr:SRPBCC family protein [Paraoerskovia marina]SDS20532.1 hypothetical protein SAMN04489860_1033 [Paraoerskovia marina]
MTRRVQVTRDLAIPVEEAYSRVLDWRSHPDWIPMTRAESNGGESFTMVSGPFVHRGVPGFPDRMVTTHTRPPSGDGTGPDGAGLVEVRKLGPGLLGDAGFEVRALRDGGSRVLWWESVYLAGPLPARVTRPAVGLFLEVFMRVSLARLDALTRARSRSGSDDGDR